MAAPRRPNPDRLLNAALALAAREPWREVTLNAIAEEAKVPLAQLRAVFSSRQAVLAALADRVDDAMLAGTDAAAANEPPRERLFDVMMRRVDALADHKEAVRSILRDSPADPMGALCAAARLLRSMAWSLEAAGIGSAGLRGRLRTKGLAVIYLSTLRVWMRDDSSDLGPTMAHLDRALHRAERMALGLGLVRPSPAEAPEAG